MLRTFGALMCLTLLAGCAVELAALAVGAVTAPIWVPIQHEVNKGKVVQPVAVKDRRGKVITPDYGIEPEDSFQITRATIICTGDHDISELDSRIGMKCNKNLKGRASFSKFTVRDASLKIGPASVPEKTIGQLTETLFSCSGKYAKQSGVVAPFLIECGRNGRAAIAEIKMKDGSQGFQVWINPPT
jgi:hypothetical protein